MVCLVLGMYNANVASYLSSQIRFMPAKKKNTRSFGIQSFVLQLQTATRLIVISLRLLTRSLVSVILVICNALRYM